MHAESRGLDIVELLRHELGMSLLARGWSVHGALPASVSAPRAAGAVASFALALGEGFEALAVYGWLREDESSRVTVVGQVGLNYRPARELLYALAGSEVSGVVIRQPGLQASVSSLEDTGPGAQRLAGFAEEQARERARLADVDALLTALTSADAAPLTRAVERGLALDVLYPPTDGLSEGERDARFATAELIPALLAGAGRREEARRALDTHAPPPDREELPPRQYRRTVRQLARWLDGEREALPSSPPQWPPNPAMPAPPASLVEAIAESIPQARARGRAIAAVRDVSEHKTPEELRELLRRELDRCEARMDSQTMDTTIDLLAAEHKPFGKTRIALRAVGALRELLGSAGREPAIFPEQFPQQADTEPSERSWRRPPDRASYPILSSDGERAVVSLDRSAKPWLERIAQDSALSLGRIRYVEVWLTWSTAAPPGSRQLDVHLGPQRVGQLDPDVTAGFRAAMAAAAERDEDPWTLATLTGSPGDIAFELELAVPA